MPRTHRDRGSTQETNQIRLTTPPQYSADPPLKTWNLHELAEHCDAVSEIVLKAARMHRTWHSMTSQHWAVRMFTMLSKHIHHIQNNATWWFWRVHVPFMSPTATHVVTSRSVIAQSLSVFGSGSLDLRQSQYLPANNTYNGCTTQSNFPPKKSDITRHH